MNTITTLQAGVSARLFAAVTIVSLLLSAFPVAFFVANAASVSISPASHDVAAVTTLVSSADTTGLENITLSFSYDVELLDNSDEFIYGWREAGGSDNQLGLVAGANEGSAGDESGVVTAVALGAGADNLANLEIYFTNTGTATTDETIFVTGISLDGDVIAPAACTGDSFETGVNTDPVQNTDSGEYFTTIQNAIDDCDTINGHTIEVAAGTYTDAVTVDKELTLEGGTVATIQAQMRLEAENITVNEFIFDGGAGNAVLLRIPGTGNGVANIAVTNNIFENMDITSNGDSAALTIESSDGTVVSDNIFRNLTTANGTFNRTMQGILIGDTGQSDDLDDITIVDNVFTNISGGRGAYGMIVNRETTGLQVLGNTISAIQGNADSAGSGWASGIGLDADTPDAIVRNNTVSGVTSLVNNAAGNFGIIGQSVAAAESITVEYNDFLAAGGAENRTAGDVDFSLNWWGSDEGPKYVDVATPANNDLVPAGVPVVQNGAGGSIETEPWLCGPFATSPDESNGGVCIGDIVKPVIVVDAPVDGVVVGSDFDITVTATDDEALDIVVVNLKNTTGGHLASCLNESAGGATTYTATCTVDVDPLAEGVYTFKTNTRDEAGNLSQTLTRSFIVDKTRPTIVVDAPVDNLMTGTGFDIEVTATDDIGIGQVVINIKDEFGAHLGTCLNETVNGATPYSTSCTVSLDDWADGTYQFKTNAKDSAGNLSNTITQTFTINTNRPTIVVDSPTSVVTTDEDFDVTVTATDDTGIAQIVINIKDEFGAHLGTCLNETVGGASPHTTSCTIDVDELPEGIYHFRTNARDTTGNLSNTINQQFIVDRTPTATVTMCKVDEQDAPLSDWTLMLQGEAVGTYEVLANSAVGVDTASVLAGVSHIVIADGTWDNNRGPLNIVDAEYSTEDNWVSSIMDGFTGFGTDILELFVGGTNGDWGPYNGSHQYAQSYVPSSDGPINLTVNDSSYGDNTGSLDVRVYEGFAGITAEDTGCVVFEDVPYGEYEVAEIMQAGFEPLSGLGLVSVDEEELLFTVVNERLPVYGAYCGDGIANQSWEQCEADDEGGTCNIATCQYENQCSELNLVKITMEETDSTSFNDTVYLGSVTNPIPSGVWFNFDEVGDASAGSIANNTQGLGVERDQATQELYLAFNGGNRGGYVDSAIGTIEFMGAEVSANMVNREPNPQFKLENGSGGSFDDVFAVTSSTSINFDLRADSGDDGVTVGLADVDMCEVPPATLEITNPATPGLTLAGEYDFTATYVDNDPTEDLINWAIYAGSCSHDGTNRAAGNASGDVGTDFSATVDMSTWTNGEYCLVVNPSEQPEEDDVRATQTFTLENSGPETFTISGVKWDDVDANGEISEVESTLSGWTINLVQEGSEAPALSTTTNGSGSYSFVVPAGTWTVTEEPLTGWTQTGQYQNGVVVATGTEGFGACTFTVPEDLEGEGGYTCSFGNQEDVEVTAQNDSGSSGSGGGSTTSTLIERVAQPQPLVLGVTTDAPQLCPFLTEYLQIGADNSTMEVMKLQAFLNIFKDTFGGTENPMTGTFGTITDANVRAFQETYRSEILDPWAEGGIDLQPTGFVYLTTQWKINDIVCPGDVTFPNIGQ